jgi:hypothetical protein
MKTNHELADRPVRKTGRAQRFKPLPIINGRQFDAVAYAAALEVLG